MFMTKAVAGKEEQEFANWLRQTARNLQQGDLPPETWELRQSPFEDSAAQRRIASLISRIAVRPKYKR